MHDDLQGPFGTRELKALILKVNFLTCTLKMLRDFQGNCMKTLRAELNQITRCSPCSRWQTGNPKRTQTKSSGGRSGDSLP